MKRESKYFNILCLWAVVMAIIVSVANADPVGLTATGLPGQVKL